MGQVAPIAESAMRGEQYAMQKDALQEKQRQDNTIWLAGAAKYALDSNMDAGTVSTLIEEGKRRGVLDQGMDPSKITKEGLIKLYRGAMTQLGGPVAQAEPQQTSPMMNFAKRQELVGKYGEDSPQVKTFDNYVRARKFVDVGGVPYGSSPSGELQPAQISQQTVTGQPTAPVTADAVARNVETLAEAKTRASQGGLELTPGQRKVDETFAKTYEEWVGQGGYAGVQKNLDQLGVALDRLNKAGKTDPQGRKYPSQTGDFAQRIFGRVATYINPDALDTLELVEEVVQRNLRLILGAQFTEKEGERLIARAYNPRLSEERNAERLMRLMKQIEEAAKAKQAAAQHYEQYGTLSNFEGPTDFGSMVQDIDPGVTVMWID